MECIRVFERWGKHQDLNPYANALEEWDERVGDQWDEPPNLMLDPKEWIQENPLFDQTEDLVSNIMESAFEKADQFLTKF